MSLKSDLWSEYLFALGRCQLPWLGGISGICDALKWIRVALYSVIDCWWNAHLFTADGGYLKRSYALSDVSPGEIDGSTFLNGSDDKSHLSDASISLEGILPSASPHLNSAPLMASPLILLPKDITPQQNTILDNINTNMLASNFNDDLSFGNSFCCLVWSDTLSVITVNRLIIPRPKTAAIFQITDIVCWLH